jgi:hypothetical protein
LFVAAGGEKVFVGARIEWKSWSGFEMKLARSVDFQRGRGKLNYLFAPRRVVFLKTSLEIESRRD